MNRTKLSLPLLLTIFVPIVGGVLLFALVLVSFEAASGVAIDEQEQKIEELVDLAGSSIERLWIAPRNHTVQALSRSTTLARRLEGKASLEELAGEWRSAGRVLEGYFFIYYGLRDGTIEYYPDGELPEGYDPRDRPWYEAGMKSEGEATWTAPYEEAITGEIVVSTVAPISHEGRKVGVMSTDITFEGLEGILEDIRLPSGGSVLLVDKSGTPFIGTNEAYVDREQLPQGGENLFVESSSPMSNGWRLSVIVPRASLAETFARLRRPIVFASALILLFGMAVVSVLVGRIASRAHRLAGYFRETLEDSTPLRQLFRTEDEFSFLNRQFNQVINDARVAEEEKLARERTFRFLIEQTPVGFFRSSRDGALMYINPHCAAMLGYTQNEAMEHISSVRQLYYDEGDRDLFLEELTTHYEVRHRKIRFKKKTGERIWISMTARLDPGTDDSKESGGFEIEGFLIDITSDIEERQSLVSMAESDPLTGAANRRAFDSAAETVAEHARSTGQTVALIVFDIDNFKSTNDTYGHDVGDRLLQHVVKIGQNLIRENDLFARLGGDEFAVLLPGSGKEAACSLAKRLRNGIDSTPAPEPLSESPTLSIGVSVQKGPDAQVPELLKAADTAMYRAKQGGRDRIECHTGSI